MPSARLRLVAVCASFIAVLWFSAGAALATSWGQGEHYTFRTDAEGWSIIEPGKVHRTLYVSASEGSDSNDGLTPETPLATWDKARRMIRAGSSDWVLLKRGDTFNVSGRFRDELQGESALHPILFGAYGDGPLPVVHGDITLWNAGQRNAVFRDMRLSSGGNIDILGNNVENILFENVHITGSASRIQGDMTDDGPNIHHVTLRRSSIIDVYRNAPADGTNGWFDNPNNVSGWDDSAFHNRISGLFATGVAGLLIEEGVYDHNGWADGYSETDPYGEAQPPNMFSHNLYLSTGNRDLTVRGNVNTRGASQGLRDGSGQFWTENLLVQNNIGGYSGDADGAGNYTTYMDNALLHPAGKRAPCIGGQGWGWSMSGVAGSEAIRNIFAHASEGQNDEGFKNLSGVLVEDYVRYNWHSWADVNPTGGPFPDPGRDIARYMQEVMGVPGATLDDFYAAVRAHTKDNWDPRLTSEAVIDWLQQGYGIWPGERNIPTVVTFTAAGGDQVRWDNSRNWSTEDLPMDGDAVDLDGRGANYAGTVELASLDLGDSGSLAVRQGFLGVTMLQTGAGGSSIALDRSGQFECDSFAGEGRLVVDLQAGRFRNRGQFSGLTTFQISGGEAELAGGSTGQAGSMILGEGSTLDIVGSGAEVGYFGDGGAGQITFLPGSRLSFEFAADGVSPIAELFSAGEVISSLHAAGDDTDGPMLALDLTALASLSGMQEYLLIDVDELSGRFSDYVVSGIGAGGVSGAQLRWDVLAGEALLTVDPDGSGGLTGFSIAAIDLPGDANGDGVVSDADYTIWADNYGATDATWAMGDFNGNGTVTEADYTIWADNYGGTSSGVPEPATLGLLGLGVSLMPRRRQ